MVSMAAKYALHATYSRAFHRGRKRMFSKMRLGYRRRDNEK